DPGPATGAAGPDRPVRGALPAGRGRLPHRHWPGHRTVGALGVRTTMSPPAVSGFPLMSSCLVEDVLYVGSRNLRPARVAAIDLTTRRTVAVHDLPTGNFVKALRSAGGPARADSTLYVGVTHAPSGPNVLRIDGAT